MARTGYAQGARVDVEIPAHLAELADRLGREGVMSSDAITVNWYLPGQYIRAHIDRPQAGPVIASLSLAGEAVMRFTNGHRGTVQFPCRPRTLVVMAGQARRHWKHETLPARALRISIVFRCSEL